jgi:hypothetical protein
LSVYVFDHTALLALGSGHHGLSRLVAAAHADAEHHLYAPALCVAAATAKDPGLADHIGALPAIVVLELGYPAAAAVGALITARVDWRLAHAVYSGRPTLDWPQGRPIVTATPRRYASLGVRTIALRV